MRRFEPSFIDEVRARVGLVELIGRDVVLTRAGREFVGLCPFHAESTPSFTVVPGKGFYYCHGCGAHGDAIDWVMHRRGLSFAEAVDVLSSLAGLAPAGVEWRADKKPLPAVVKPAAGREARKRLEWAADIWRACGPAPGTLVETYLRARGLGGADIPPTLRFHPSLKHPPSGTWLPAMVGYVQGGAGAFTGIHRTYLAVDGKSKADVSPAKMMAGRVFGGYLRLCPAAPVMCIAEGIETALSVMQAAGRPTWAALAEGNLCAPLPPLVREVIICADNDARDKETSLKRLRAAAASHAARGARARIAWPPEGQDFNDALNAPGAPGPGGRGDEI